MLSVTWAFGPPIAMKVPHICHAERSEASAFFFVFTSRFFVASLLRMTGLGDFRRSVAKHLLYLIENRRKADPSLRSG